MRAMVWVGLMLAAEVAWAQTPQQEAKRHFQQGKAYQDNGAYEDAVREYEAAYKLAPLPDLLFNIGQAYRLKGDRRKAIEAYQKYLAAAPEGSASDEARDQIRT